MRPVTQQGYRLEWHGKLIVGLAGITFTNTGPESGDGGIYDIQYQPGEGWQTGGDNGGFFYWQFQFRPGPASCNGLDSDPARIDVSGQAHVGDRYCFVPAVGQAYGYMQVTKVDSAGVT